ncbi:hypothetical protein PHJA_000766000 [Phtheirospermum japonicum]|uniref:Late embryogenesis abundant protein LEA-2 subgroup domain-containing protein n=1 Tax=Phtheirospermum japonicum TaxID=374723 RepID=A0A830BJ46_9LAMI|nr:hypothetical protein PHJA_000766000 [Phtheirospermum japonicum]
MAVNPTQKIGILRVARLDGSYNLTSDGRLSGNFTFVVRANNSNKAGFSFHYDKITATASYKDRDLFTTDNIILPFYQPRRNVTTLNLNLAARDYKAANESLARDLRMERGIRGLNSGLKIRVKMRLKFGVLRVILHRTLKVSCGQLKVPFFGEENQRKIMQKLVKTHKCPLKTR